MRTPQPLPTSLLNTGFSVAEARALGVTPARLRSGDLFTPFYGVRTVRPPSSIWERASALAKRLGPGKAIAGIAAAQLWGMPVPRRMQHLGSDLEVLTSRSATRVRTKGVHSRSIRDELFRAVSVRGVPIVQPTLALVTSAVHLDVEEVTVMLDSLLASASNYPGLLLRARPHLRPDDLGWMLEDFHGLAGARTLRKAVLRARASVESPMETVTRLRLVDAGLPEPEVQPWFVLPNGEEFRPDLGYPWARTYVDYEGGHHARDPEVFANDLRRERAIRDAGGQLFRITGSDLRGERLRALVQSIRRAIASGQSQSTDSDRP
ncbi:hypothetical protein [Gulosibacter sp. 10]|uniref:hypothetical protein n=1 Tax=Gulosibacter sp. 10 TaxID=1255570 RepID=UPI00112337E8|nr:hypothetical protein [Gulosibacter sp. 10]